MGERETDGEVCVCVLACAEKDFLKEREKLCPGPPQF